MQRPRIVCHGFVSIDGRIHPDRWTEPAIGTRPNVVSLTDRQTMVAMHADGIITCIETIAGAHGIALGRPLTDAPSDAANFFIKRLERPLCIVHDPRAMLRLSTNRYEEGQIILIVARDAHADYLEQARLARVSYVFAGDDGMDLAAAMQAIHGHYGSTLLVLRADGRTNSAFMAAGLVDQVSVLVFPGLDATSGDGSLFESAPGAGPAGAAGKSLLHVSTQTLDGGIVWLRYLVEQAGSSRDLTLTRADRAVP